MGSNAAPKSEAKKDHVHMIVLWRKQSVESSLSEPVQRVRSLGFGCACGANRVPTGWFILRNLKIYLIYDICPCLQIDELSVGGLNLAKLPSFPLDGTAIDTRARVFRQSPKSAGKEWKCHENGVTRHTTSHSLLYFCVYIYIYIHTHII